jgi:four helix bundle protein
LKVEGSTFKNIGSIEGDAIRYSVGRIKSFEEFEVWKQGRDIVLQVYRLTGRKAFASDFGLTGQIRRASISIISNIAEGYESQSNNVFIRYLRIAKGSCGEVRSQLYVALDQKYLSEEEFNTCMELCLKTSAKLSSLIKYLVQSKN